jgi:predicted transglutaminase-like cysteine proteinase
VLALCTAITVTAAWAVTPYSFDAPNQYLTRAQDYPRWAALWAHHLEQTPAIDACLADATQCPDYLKGYREVIVRAHDLTPQRKMTLVNRFINSRRWHIESAARDDWRTLTDFLHYSGDCEDYAIAKYFALRQLGIPAGDIRVGITWDFETSAYHAVTVMRIDNQIYFLDVDGAPRRTQASYRFLFSINEIAVWDHVPHKTALHVSKSEEDGS